MIKKELSIIILTYKSLQIIANLLAKLNLEKHQVILVDNASKDGTVDFVQSNFPKVKIIELEKNIGYGRANNIALNQVETDFALLLNPDVFIEEEAIDLVLYKIKKDQKIALASPIIYGCEFEDGKIVNERKVEKANDKSIIGESEDFYFTKFITGAGMFMNMKAMKKIGFFDENFFLYCEDNELCKRVKLKGYKKAIVKNSKFHHLSGKSSQMSQKETKKVYWHKFGWSKCYYAEVRRGKFLAKLKALTIILKAIKGMLKDIFASRKISIINQSMLKGSFAYLIGLKAFDKNDNARG